MKHLSGAPFYGRLLALPTNIRLGWKRNVSDKHSSLLRKFVNYGQKQLFCEYRPGPCFFITYIFFIEINLFKLETAANAIKPFLIFVSDGDVKKLECLIRMFQASQVSPRAYP